MGSDPITPADSDGAHAPLRLAAGQARIRHNPAQPGFGEQEGQRRRRDGFRRARERLPPARPTNIASGTGYRGVNVLAPWVAAEIARYDSGLWGTYRQWQALEAPIRKGERGTTVVLWKQANPAGDDDRAGDEDSPARRIF